MSMLDVEPTLGNMFGFENKYALGHDIFSIDENFVVFLDEIEQEVNNLTKIEKLDFLYDILDSIYECKLILKQFNKFIFTFIYWTWFIL